MSVIVGIKENGKVYIGADSQVTKGTTRLTCSNVHNCKIWAVRNVPNCLMAHVGACRDANRIRLLNCLIDEYDLEKDRVNFSYVVKTIVPKIVKELRDCEFLSGDSPVPSMDSSYLFAYKDKLYTIGFDCCVIEVDGSVALGSGEDQALGSLVSTEGESPRSRIIKAIRASVASDIYVNYPIVLSDTETGQIEVINEDDVKKILKEEKERK